MRTRMCIVCGNTHIFACGHALVLDWRVRYEYHTFAYCMRHVYAAGSASVLDLRARYARSMRTRMLIACSTYTPDAPAAGSSSAPPALLESMKT